MKTKIPVFFILIVSLFCFLCAPKEEEAVITLEEAGPAAALPMSGGEQVWAFRLPESYASVQEAAMYQILMNQVVQALDAESGVTLVQVQKSDTYPHPPAFQLSGQCERRNGGYVYAFDWKESTTGTRDEIAGESGSLFNIAEVLTDRMFSDAPHMQNLPVQVTRVPLEIEEMFVLANAYLLESNHQKTDQAVQLLKSIVARDSTFVPAWLSMAEAYLQIMENRWNRNRVWLQLAKTSCQKALEINPQSARAYALMGRILIQWGDFRQARDQLLQAAALNSNLANTWLHLGQIYSRFGLYTSAKDAYQFCLDHQPENWQAVLGASMIDMTFQAYESAEAHLASAVVWEPENQDILMALALARLYQDKAEEARLLTAQALQLNEDAPFVHAIHAMALASLGNQDEALNEVVMHVDPNTHTNSHLMVASAAVYALLGMTGKSIQLIEKAVEHGYYEYPWLVNDPHLKGVRSDPRMETVLADAKLKWEEAKQELSISNVQ